MDKYFIASVARGIYKKTKRHLVHSYHNLTDRKTKVLVLVYHRVLADAEFNPLNNIISLPKFINQIDAIARSYSLVSLTDIINQCRSGQAKAKAQAVLTFDDGYSDNYATVFPLLQKKGLPATFFLATDYINSGGPLWDWQLINILNNNTSARSIEIDNQVIRQGFLEPRLSFIFRILDKIKPVSFQERQALISSLRAKAGDKLGPGYTNDRCMSWQEVKKMSEAGMEIGSHSLSHRSLAMIPLPEAREEMRASKEMIERNTQKPCSHFSFPYGGKRDYNQGLVDCVQEAGYQTCLLNVHGYNHFAKDAFCFKRIIMEEATCVRSLLG